MKNMKKETPKPEEIKKEEEDLPKIKADILPPVQFQRRGQFEMIPDFLKQKEVFHDMNSLNDQDLMEAALRKQEEANKEAPSMSELFAKKRTEREKQIEEQKMKSNNDVEDRKARLLAQRDLLRKQKEDKRQEELKAFNAKTETKEGLFNELKNIDAQIDEKKKKKDEEADAQRRKEIMKKARQDAENEKKQENEANY